MSADPSLPPSVNQNPTITLKTVVVFPIQYKEKVYATPEELKKDVRRMVSDTCASFEQAIGLPGGTLDPDACELELLTEMRSSDNPNAGPDYTILIKPPKHQSRILEEKWRAQIKEKGMSSLWNNPPPQPEPTSVASTDNAANLQDTKLSSAVEQIAASIQRHSLALQRNQAGDKQPSNRQIGDIVAHKSSLDKAILAIQQHNLLRKQLAKLVEV